MGQCLTWKKFQLRHASHVPKAIVAGGAGLFVAVTIITRHRALVIQHCNYLSRIPYQILVHIPCNLHHRTNRIKRNWKIGLWVSREYGCQVYTAGVQTRFRRLNFGFLNKKQFGGYRWSFLQLSQSLDTFQNTFSLGLMITFEFCVICRMWRFNVGDIIVVVLSQPCVLFLRKDRVCSTLLLLERSPIPQQWWEGWPGRNRKIAFVVFFRGNR